MNETDDGDRTPHLTRDGPRDGGASCPVCGGALVPGLWRCVRCGFTYCPGCEPANLAHPPVEDD
jgi:hypothetical protein